MNEFSVYETIDKWFETLLVNFKDYGTTDWEFKININTLTRNSKRFTHSKLISLLNKEGIDVKVGNDFPIIRCHVNIHNLNKTRRQSSEVLMIMQERAERESV